MLEQQLALRLGLLVGDLVPNAVIEHGTVLEDLDDGAASLDLAISVIGYFELDESKAYAIAAEVGQAVATWRKEATRLGLTQAEIERMASAFEHEDLNAVLSIS